MQKIKKIMVKKISYRNLIVIKLNSRALVHLKKRKNKRKKLNFFSFNMLRTFHSIKLLKGWLWPNKLFSL
jgi:hypothetical protein